MVYLLFFLTGAAGLIYEISWSRQIGIFFGHTVNAAAVVLAAYFGGMALGYALAARWSSRAQRPLRGYALCELGVALWALATPQLLKLFALPGVAALLNNDDATLQTLARILAALLVLLPATIALGATLPFVAQHLSRLTAGAEGRRRTTMAYALNTAGAVSGVLLTTFVLILNFGVAHSSYLAACISATCGLGAWWLAGRQHETAQTVTSSVAQVSAGRPSKAGLWLLLAALSGFGTLGLQVLYVRLFAMTFNNSTYTFGGIVAVFLLALALGSWLYARNSQLASPRAWIAWASLAGAASIPVSVWLFQQLTSLHYFSAPGGFWGYIGAALLLIAAVLGLPVLLLGLLLPAIWAGASELQASAVSNVGSGNLEATPSNELGAVVGRLTSVNTLAATVASLAASFLILPWLGLWHSFWLLSAVYLALGLALLLPGMRRWQTACAAGALTLLCMLAAHAMDIDLVARAPSKGQRYLYLKDSAYGRIDVLEDLKDHSRVLRQNRNYTLGGTTGDTLELRQGLLPLLLHPAPKQVCFLGLATGITSASAIMDTRVQQSTSVELIPEVAEAASLFASHNGDVLKQPKEHLVVNDARYYLYATNARYDVIISDLFVPWHSQTGYLYTVEHYTAARARLAPGGIFCQWLPLYQLGPRELELILNSFASVFPHCSLWRGEDPTTGLGTLALIGTEKPLLISQARFNARAKDLRPPPQGQPDTQLADSEKAAALYLGDWIPGGPEEDQADSDAAPQLNTDEYPRVEFLAPLAKGDDALLQGQRLQDYTSRRLSKLPRWNILWLP